MQEIEIPPRDVFQHYLQVDQPDKTLVWSFSTRKKNISFGLFLRPQQQQPQRSNNSLAPSFSTSTTSTSPTSPIKPDSLYSQRRPSHPQQGSSAGHFARDGILSSSPTKSSHYAASIEHSASDDEENNHHIGGDLGDGISINLQTPGQASLPQGTKPS
ncbi:hypothetical protein BGZ65_010584, partial [Modicella reniformis]